MNPLPRPLNLLPLMMILGFAATTLSGCALVEDRMARATIERDLPDVYEASILALRDMQFPIRNQTLEADTARISARTTDSRVVSIRLARSGPSTTELEIQAGVFDRELASQIRGAILGHL